MEKENIVLILKNEVECLTFYSEPDVNAPAVEFECKLAPGSRGPSPHIHTVQTETFHEVSGVMIARLKGRDEINEYQAKEDELPRLLTLLMEKR